jgi:hypothetical protein
MVENDKKGGEVVEGAWEFTVGTPATEIVLNTSAESGSMTPREEKEVTEVVRTIEKLKLVGISFHCDLEKGFGLDIKREPTVIKTVVTKKKERK